MIKIVITRPLDAAENTAESVRQQGFEPIVFPLLKLLEMEYIRSPLDNSYQWLLFTSSNAVRFFMNYFKKHYINFDWNVKIAAIGPTTAKTVEKFNMKADFIPEQFNRTAISEEMPVIEGDRILYPTLLDGPTRIEDILKRRGCVVERLNVYRSEPIIYSEDKWYELVLRNPDVTTFFSARTVDAYFKNRQSCFDLNHYTMAVLAESSANALLKRGYTIHLKPDVPTADNLLEKIKGHYAQLTPSEKI